jgi:uncharacterized protein (DUF2164 family)
MLSSLSKEQKTDLVSSLRRYFTEELDGDLSEIQAGFLLEYIFSEIAPLAYNQGVGDARKYFATAAEDLPGTCFQEALTYWKTRRGGREVRRKPGS